MHTKSQQTLIESRLLAFLSSFSIYYTFNSLSYMIELIIRYRVILLMLLTYAP